MEPIELACIGLLIILIWIITFLFGHNGEWIDNIHYRNMSIFAEIIAHILLFTVAPFLYIVYALEWFFQSNWRGK